MEEAPCARYLARKGNTLDSYAFGLYAYRSTCAAPSTGQNSFGSPAASKTRLLSANVVCSSFVPDATRTGALSDAIASMGRRSSADIPSRSGSCQRRTGARTFPALPRRLVRRSVTAAAIVGYIDSSTTAFGGGSAFERTNDAVLSETPITPIGSLGSSRRR